jgi:hypothetical protein
LEGREIFISFWDMQTSKQVMLARANHSQIVRVDLDEAMLDELFAQLYPKFFPDRPNPFGKK